MSSNQIQIPQHLDEPTRIAIFTVDEFVLVVGGVFAAVLTKKIVIGLIAVFASYKLYQKIKTGVSARRVMARLYWVAPPAALGMNRSPDAVIRSWVG